MPVGLLHASAVNIAHCFMVRACFCCACRRVDAATASRAGLSREEVELIDVAAEMEQQLVQQYTLVSTPATRGHSTGVWTDRLALCVPTLCGLQRCQSTA